jgi:hypothetical protein
MILQSSSFFAGHVASAASPVLIPATNCGEGLSCAWRRSDLRARLHMQRTLADNQGNRSKEGTGRDDVHRIADLACTADATSSIPATRERSNTGVQGRFPLPAWPRRKSGRNPVADLCCHLGAPAGIYETARRVSARTEALASTPCKPSGQVRSQVSDAKIQLRPLERRRAKSLDRG